MYQWLRTRGMVHAGLVAVAAVACAPDASDSEQSASADSVPAMGEAAAPAAPAEAPGAAISDPQIAAILAASDSAEIQPSQLAASKAQNARVKQFAQMMIAEHTALSDSVRAMAQQNNFAPEPNPTSQQMQSQTQATLQSLQGLSGAAFDSAYVQAMVQSHQTALSTVESQLLPAAQNQQLRTSLEQKVRPAVAMHLQQIQDIQRSLTAH